MIGTLAIVLATAYGAAFLVAARRADAQAARLPRVNRTPPRVSVLVAARNEAATLDACLAALRRQTYPADRYEIIVADDHSEDETAEIAAREAHRCIHLSDREGKAAALHAAYSVANGDVLVVTDADCRPPPDWVRSLVAQFDDPEIGVVCGVTSVRHHDLLGRVQALDWALLMTTAAGLSALGVPLTAMGNNMAFRRAAYEEIGGYPAIPVSVTEDFALFRAVKERTGWQVRLILDRALENRTEPLDSLRRIVAQRRRWARGGLRAGWAAYLLYAFVWSVHAMLVGALLASPGAALLGITVKGAADAGVLRTAGRHVRLESVRSAFPLFEAFFFGYVLLLPFSLLAVPSISWRGRTY